MVATVAQLSEELRGIVTALPSFTNSGFNIYDMDDLETVTTDSGVQLPLVGVSYEGGAPAPQKQDAAPRGSRAGLMHQLQFAVIIGVEYSSAASPTDTKVMATDLLDEVRGTVLGYTGVNKRPWGFVSEGPQGSSLEGVIFYGQLWSTLIPVIGNQQR